MIIVSALGNSLRSASERLTEKSVAIVVLKNHLLLLRSIPILVFSIFPSVVLPEQAEKPEPQQQQSEEGAPKPEQEKEKNQEHAPSSPTVPGYTEVEIAKVASGTKDLANRKVKVVVNAFMPSKTKLGPDLSTQFVAFDAYNYKQSTKSITAIVPKQISDAVANLRAGQFVALYGQLALFFSRKTSSGKPVTDWSEQLILMVDRIEPHQ